MRITGGELRGRIIKGSIAGRPSLMRVKHGVFSVLYSINALAQLNFVVDLYCGSGAYGIESISRGAKKVYFVDRSYKSIRTLKENINSLKIAQNRFEIFKSDVFKWAQLHKDIDFDLAFIDPPYSSCSFSELLTILKANTVVIESEKEINFVPEDYIKLVNKQYGGTLVTIFKRKDSTNG